MPILSVDLASGNYADIGVTVLMREGGAVLIAPVDLPSVGLSGRPDARRLAEFLSGLAAEFNATAIGLDGPQGWKSASNGLEHSRRCEALLRTQGKTGLPGVTKPANYLGFIRFCVETFDELDRIGWPRLKAPEMAGRTAIETFPTAAWRALGMVALPGKARAGDTEVAEWTARLVNAGLARPTGALTHDQLQAAVSGLGVLALSECATEAYEAVGDPPFQEDGHWLEGYIVNPRA